MQSFSNGKQIFSVNMMFSYLQKHNHPVSSHKLSEFDHIFSDNCWGDPSLNISYSPNDVLSFPEKYPNDHTRITNADLSYPIIITSNNHVIDGVHRLSHCLKNNIDTINAYFFDEDLLNKFMICDTIDWDFVDNLDLDYLDNLFNERF